MICVDASVLATFALPDESPSDAEKSRLRSSDVVIPALCRLEFLNILVVNERRGRLRAADSQIALDWFADLGAQVDADGDLQVTLDLARRHRLTAYDAAYLELALRRRLPLLTRDAVLATAARAEGVAG